MTDTIALICYTTLGFILGCVITTSVNILKQIKARAQRDEGVHFDEETRTTITRLLRGCVLHPDRWDGDGPQDLGGTVDKGATRLLMRDAAVKIAELRGQLLEDPARYKQLEAFEDSVAGLWATDRPDLFKNHPHYKKLFRINGVDE